MRTTERTWLMVLAVMTASSAALGVASASTTYAPAPAIVATPKATCGPGSRPEPGLQGRVSPADHASTWPASAV